jgi:hypothetical protein
MAANYVGFWVCGDAGLVLGVGGGDSEGFASSHWPRSVTRCEFTETTDHRVQEMMSCE